MITWKINKKGMFLKDETTEEFIFYNSLENTRNLLYSTLERNKYFYEDLFGEGISTLIFWYKLKKVHLK